MGHNVSKRKRPSVVTGSCIIEFVDWTSVIHCPRCRKTTVVRVQEAWELHGARKVSDIHHEAAVLQAGVRLVAGSGHP